MSEILIRSMKQPEKYNLQNDIEWFCESLGLLSERDKNKTAVKIFKTIIKMAKNGPTNIEFISNKIGMSRTAVSHHIARMKNAGIIVREGNKIELRSTSLQKIVDEIELDVSRTLKSIREIAEDIDDELKMPVRKRR